LKARFVFTAEGPPIRDGVIAIEGARIAAVGQARSGDAVVDLGNAAILPGLVNAHTHLEFSDLAAPIGSPNMPFADWIRAVVAYRRSRTEAERAAAVRQGLSECSRLGTTTVGEIATAGWPVEAFATTAPRAVESLVFLESIGLRESRIEPALEASRLHLALAATRDLRLGLSPHAPYTVHPDLIRRLAGLSATAAVPLAMHLAESREELELLETNRGPLRDLLVELDAWDDEAIPLESTPLDYLRLLSAAWRALVIHGNYLNEDEIAFLGRRAAKLSVIYCPRTHAYFGHPPYPLAKLLQAGANVALGTDSRASNPDLDLLAEMREIAARHIVPPEWIVEMATINGARALGLEREIGSLAPGKRADITIVHLPESKSDEPYELLFEPRSRASEGRDSFSGRH
jgi:cytosine/adenosine deaminase-related metal-dependent hydrolase